MSAGALFLTGATGLVGRHVLAALAPEAREVRALVRGLDGPQGARLRTVAGDLTRPETYASALAGCELVLHLAASTGRATEREHQRVNGEGTERLVAAARAAGVRRFLHVSTIAVRYPDQPHYPYARAKERAERAVVAAGLAHVIVRPTIVLGRDAPAWRSAESLARLPVVPLPGGARARIQPIDVDDLARGLVLLLGDASLDGQCLELGGPEQLSFADFLRRAQRARSGRPARSLPLPLRPVLAGLAAWERLGLPLPPVTAGQLAAFVHDSDARPNALQARLAPQMLDVDAMLARYVGRG